MITVYKVVTVQDGRYFSFIKKLEYVNFPSAALEYKIGETTVPAFGKLFAFDTLENANAYRRLSDEILECTAPDLELLDSPIVPFGDSSIAEMKQYWDQKYVTPTYNNSWGGEEFNNVPLGTRLCSSLLVVRLIPKLYES